MDASSGNVTITLPTAVSITQLFAVKRIDSSGNTVTIATTSSQPIDGLLTRTLVQYQEYVLGSNNSSWDIYASYLPSPLTTEGDILYLHSGVLSRLTLDPSLVITGGVLSVAYHYEPVTDHTGALVYDSTGACLMAPVTS